jgi:hypothetical protein
MLLPLTCLVLSGMVGTTPATVAYANQRVVADTEPELTPSVLTKMATFWTAFMKEPVAIRTDGVKANQEKISVRNGTLQVVVMGANIVAMAAKYPSVAADLKQAGLTALEWESYRKEFYSAAFSWSALGSQEDAGMEIRPDSPLGYNIVVLMRSKKEYEALKATGVIPTPLPAGVAVQ